ncbi:toll/interleukin-1 receptor domain-containing protein [Piscinibacter sakaiensis]|uniref:toll/interleukin-1 receptor domain-containing protein n=1 Tax=Piscinibacter sakaiensis TaxID=1547922 RepID=UPI003AAF98AD
MSGIFISYRRTDAQGWAGRLAADLAAAFGDVARFFDLHSIPPGTDFLREIERRLAAADAVLVLIGPGWLSAARADGSRRLDDPADVVAAEVAHALTLDVPVIPVLLGGVAMPGAATLPERLHRLARLNAFELSDQRWEYDRDRLFDALGQATPLRRRPPSDTQQPASGGVSVGAGLQMQGGEVGRVTGARGAMPAAGVDVLNNASLTDVKIGEITGVEIKPPSQREP